MAADVIGLGSAWSLAKEVTFNTAQAPTRMLPFLKESLKLDRHRIDSMTMKGGNFLQTSDTWRESVRAGAGDVQTLLYSSGGTMLWEAMLGSISTTGVGPYTHTAAVAKSLPSYTMDVGIGGITSSDLRKTITGAKVEKWQMKLAANENATLGTSWVYADETISVAAARGAYPSNMKPFTFIDGAFSGAGKPTGNIEAITFNGENNVKKDQWTIGSQIMAEPVRSARAKIHGEMDVTLDGTVTNYNLWSAGNEVQLVCTLTQGSNTLTITSNVRIDGTSPAVESEGKVIVKIPFTVIAATTDALAFQVVAVNGDTTP